MLRTIIRFLVAVLVVVGIYFAYQSFKDDIAQLWDNFHVKIAEYPQPKKTVWLDQNVSKEELSWFYHADQGTRTFGIPHEWFMALQRPELFSSGLLSDSAYLDRYGFIPDTIIPGKKALPIGFTQGGPMADPSGEPWRNPRTKQDMTGVGLTCAGCHTGRFTYKDTAVIIDGGPALTDLFRLKQGMGVSLFLTRFLPWRFSQFAESILGPDSTVDERETLKFQLNQVLQQYNDVKGLEQAVATTSIEEGYGRLDALNRIGNQVFSQDLNKPENYRGSSAPVHYPRIWNTPWFDWVQYNGSIMQPMVRNAGEALGVSAELNLTAPSKGLFKSSVPVKTLHAMERMIAGDPPVKEFSGLTSPKWPEEILGRINWDLAKQGASLYKVHCQECHRPAFGSKAIADEDKDKFFTERKWWTTNDINQPMLVMEMIPIEHIGTDSAQAADMLSRTVALPTNLGITNDSFGFALGDVVQKVVDYWYDVEKTPPEERQKINGYRPNQIQAPLAYKVRPLNGVWATPPYLHNGSVPTIDALLGPAEGRLSKFYLGNREYDPVKLGYKTDKLANGFELDTSIRGNANTGHRFSKEYNKDKNVTGLIGEELDETKRKAIIEFLKTL